MPTLSLFAHAGATDKRSAELDDAIGNLIDTADESVDAHVEDMRRLTEQALSSAFGPSTALSQVEAPKATLEAEVIDQLLSSDTINRRSNFDRAMTLNERTLRRNSSTTAQARELVRKSKRNFKKMAKLRLNSQKILSVSTTSATLPQDTISSLCASHARHEKRLVDSLDSVEVTVHGVTSHGAFVTESRMTYVQVNWIDRGHRKFSFRSRKKVKTNLREGTDCPLWGPEAGRFIFGNCLHGGYVLIKLKELRSFGRKVEIGSARIAGSMIPRGGTQMTLDLELRKKGLIKTNAEIRVTVGQSIFSEPAIGDNGYWPKVTPSAESVLDVSVASTLMPSASIPKWELRPTPTLGGASSRPKYVILSVLNARGVYDADRSGTSDPFVKIGFNTSLVDDRYTTRTKRMTTFPVWNQRYFLCVPQDEACQAIVLTVWDRDRLSSPNFIGAAALPLSEIPRGGALADLEIELKRRITADAAGEPCYIHPRATQDLGTIRVQVSEIVDEKRMLDANVSLGEIKRGEGLLEARSVHVAVVAARNLFRVDSGAGSCDAFTYVSIDNAPLNEFCRSSTVKNTLHPVWNNGIGEVFTLVARPGAGRVLVDLFDRDMAGKKLMGQAHVSLAGLPDDGAWAEIVTPLFGTDANRNFLVGGTDASSPWNSPDRIKGEIILRVSTTRAPYPNMRKPPQISEADRYDNSHETNKYLYVQTLNMSGLPIRYNAQSTNTRVVMSLNTHRTLIYGDVQKNVMTDFDFDDVVHAFPKSHLSRTLTIQVLSELKLVYGSKQVTNASKTIGKRIGLIKALDDDAAANGAEDELGARNPVKEGEKFISGTPIGFVQIRIDDMAVGDLKRYKVKLNPMLREAPWLQAKDGSLGEIEIAIGCGYAKTTPLDLRMIDQVARPTLGTFMFNIESVIGDPTPYQDFAPFVGVLTGKQRTKGRNKFGKHVAATVMWDGREENIVSSQEFFKFNITEATGDIRVIFTCPDALNGGTQILGAVSIPIQSIMEAPGRSVDAWYNITPPNRAFLTQEEMVNHMHAMCVYLRSKKILSDWQGYARIRVAFTPKRAEWRWYLRQAPPPLKSHHVPDTVDGVVRSFHRLVESILAPLKMYARASLFVAKHPTRFKINAAWFVWHTLCCWTFRAEIISSFLLLWLVSGIFFCGYCAHVIADEVYALMSPFEGETKDGQISQLQHEVRKLGKKKNRKLRMFRDALLEEYKLVKLRAKGRAVEVSAQAVRKGMQERKARRAQAGIDDELPDVSILPRNIANHVFSILVSNNPADVILAIIQKTVWNLLKIIKDAGTTLVRFDKVITSGGPRLMSGSCKVVGGKLESLASTLDRPVTAVTWGNVALSRYFAALSIALTFVACLILFVLRQFVRLVDFYSPIRLWHCVWVIGILPVLPISASFMIHKCVRVENFLQLVGLYVPIVPISLETMQAVRDALVDDLKDDYVKLRARAKAEFEQEQLRAKQAEITAFSSLYARFAKNSSNPIMWIFSALSRAPTSLAVLHGKRVRALMRPGEDVAPDVKIFREHAQLGRTVIFSFGQLISFALAMPVKVVTAPSRILSATMERRLNFYDSVARVSARGCVSRPLTLPFGAQRIKVIPERISVAERRGDKVIEF
jgi:hypothetical protein